MRSKGVVWLGIGLMLTACSAPPKDVPAPIEAPTEGIEVMTTEPELAELPPQEAAPQRRGMFGFLRREAATPEPVTAAELPEPERETPIAPALTAEELAAMGVVETEETAPNRPRGLRGLFKRRAEPLPDPAAAPEPELALPQTEAAPTALPSPGTQVPVAAAEPAERPRGLRGLFTRNRDRDASAHAEVVLVATPPPDGEDPVLDSAPDAPVEPLTTPDPQPRLRAWPFGRSNRPPAPDLAQPEFPTIPGTLAFGQVTEACDVKKRDLGTQVSRANGYKLYDTAPNSVIPRTQYITGFKDGCPRRFTAALALFGSAQVHEAKRYDASNRASYSETDLAFERVKNRICGTRKGQFCPPNRAQKLDRDTTFLTAYRGFGDTGLWLEIFLHKGKLVAFQTRSN